LGVAFLRFGIRICSFLRRKYAACTRSPPESDQLSGKNMNKRAGLVDLGFFLLRTPALTSAGVYRDTALSNNVPLSEVRALFETDEMREILFLASESLYEAIYQRTPNEREIIAAVKYFIRSSLRPTPFGASASISLGNVSSETKITLSDRVHRSIEIDQDVAASWLELHASVSPSSVLRLNDSLVDKGSYFSFVTITGRGSTRRYRLDKIEKTEALSIAVSKLATGPQVCTTILAALVTKYPHQNSTTALGFLTKLFKAGVVELAPSIKRDAQTDLLGQAKIMAFSAGKGSNKKIVSTLKAVGMNGSPLGERMAAYKVAQSISQTSDPLSLPFRGRSPVYLVQTRECEEISLSKQRVGDLATSLSEIRTWLLQPTGRLTKFKEALYERYADGCVPLSLALDAETGLGSDWYFQPTPHLEQGRDNSDLIGIINTGISQRKREVHIPAVRPNGNQRQPLPPFFTIHASLVALGSENDLRWEFKGGLGAPALATLGRFGAAIPELADKMREIAAQEEEEAGPDCIIAEVDHVPDGRIGNVLIRPRIYSTTISYLGGSCSSQQSMKVEDLSIQVHNGTIWLRHNSTGRRILPRLTHAHGYDTAFSLPIYRFLGLLQKEEQGNLSFSIGGFGLKLPYVPRIVYKNLILSREQWRLSVLDVERLIEALKDEASSENGALDNILNDLLLPPTIRISRSDNFLEVDLRTKLGRSILMHELKKPDQPLIEEVLEKDLSITKDTTGKPFRNELIIPVRDHSNSSRRQSAPPMAFADTHPPGGEWLYLKAYVGDTWVREKLLSQFSDLARSTQRMGGLAYFVRYIDRAKHIRLRATAPSKWLWGEFRETLESVFSTCRFTYSTSLSYETYAREVTRYGGLEGVQHCERIFAADSVAAADIWSSFPGLSHNFEAQVEIAALGYDSLLNDFGLSKDEKRVFLAQRFEAYKAEQLHDKSARSQVKEFIRSVSIQNREKKFDVAHLDNIFKERSSQMHPDVAGLIGKCATWMSSPLEGILHMSANRLFEERSRYWEMVSLGVALRRLEQKSYTS